MKFGEDFLWNLPRLLVQLLLDLVLTLFRVRVQVPTNRSIVFVAILIVVVSRVGRPLFVSLGISCRSLQLFLLVKLFDEIFRV